MPSGRINPQTGKRYNWIDPKQAEKDRAALTKEIALIERQQHALEAREHLLTYTKFTMPDPADPNDLSRSMYEDAVFHREVAKALEAVEKGELPQLIFAMPPRHGKTELATKRMAAWYSGRHPTHDVIVAAASDLLAEDMGADVRAIMHTPQHRQVFPTFKLRRGGNAKNNIQTDAGGRLIFAGKGGTINGRGAHLLLIDDLYKDFAEARSETMRDAAWDWFTKVAMMRRMGKKLVIITMCMTGDTLVLMADGQEKALRDIRPDDLVASYDDGQLVASRIVNHINNGPDLCYEIRMTSGITVKANERHPFLVDCDGDLKWTRLRELKKGDAIVRVSGVSGKAYLASTKAVSSPLNAKDTASPTTTNSDGRTASDQHLTTRGREEPCGLSSVTASLSKLTTLWSNVKTAAVQCAKNLRVKMSARIGAENCASITATIQERSEGFSATTAIWRSATEKQRKNCWPLLDTYEITKDEVFSIEPVGREDVYDVQVEGTENFIANGLVSHNTRWHSDDIIGRLTDPENPHYNAEEAKMWKIIRLPGLAEEDDPLGRQPGEALWPERYDEDYHKGSQRRDPLGFAALVQQRPSVLDGVLFRRENIQYYDPKELPENLRYYAASDHAVNVKQRNDPSCFIKVGVDQQNNIYIVEAIWKKMKTDLAVEAMLTMATTGERPLLWWAERGHITGSIGPFLYKRMQESGRYINIVEVTPKADKEQRAQSIAARVAMGKVLFPRGLWWTEKAVDELMAFPNGTHDDFADALAYIGLGLQSQFGPEKKAKDKIEPTVGSLAWLKQQDKLSASRTRLNSFG